MGNVRAPRRPAEGSPSQHAQLPPFPLPVRLPNGRLYNWQHDLDCYEAELRALSLNVEPVYPPRPERDALIPTNEIGARFGVGRRTVGRWIRAAQDAAAKEADATRKETIAAK
jgi:hypothetical protein